MSRRIRAARATVASVSQVVSFVLSCYGKSMPFVAVARLADLPERRGVCVSVGRCEIAVFKIEGEVFAIDNTCPHRAGPLSEGDVFGTHVYCPMHAWGFDLRSGLSHTNKRAWVRSYPVRIEEGQVEVEVEEKDLVAGAVDDPEAVDYEP
jgi:nitrite reductase (NADH) small subunit